MDVIDLEDIVPKTEGERTPGFKLLLTILVGAALAVPLFSVWLLVYDRQTQSKQATASITEGWGGKGGSVKIDYRPVHDFTLTQDVQYIKPKARVY